MNHSRTVILARVSSKSQEDEGYSLDSQLKLLQNYCDSKNLHVIKTFKIAETASKEQSRKIFHELLNYVSENSITHLAVEKTDRFTRNFRDAVAIDDWLEKDPSRRLHAVKENLLLHKEAKSDVKFMWNIHLSVAKKYTDNLREEAMKGWAEKLAQGWLPGVPPPGYMTITKSGKRIHIPNPETKHLIKYVFELYLEPNQSIASLANEMKHMGLVTRKGRPYSKSHVQRILTNPFYIGINHHNGKDYPGLQETFITKEVFERVQQKMHAGRPRVFVKHNPVFKGIIRCQDCGSAVTWQLQKGRYYGVCRRESKGCYMAKLLREDKIEERVIESLERLVSPTPEVLGWLADAMRSHYENATESSNCLIASIETQIDRLQRMDDNLYDDKLSGEISKEKYDDKYAQLLNERAELYKRLEKIKRVPAKQLEHRLALLELSQRAAEIYCKKPTDQKRIILSKLFEELTLKGGSLSVKFTKFTQAIAENVQETCKLMEVIK